MQFDSFSAFLDMGGYGFYVWLSFGVSTVLLAGLIFSSITNHNKVIKDIATRKQSKNKLRQVRKDRKNSKTMNPKRKTNESPP